MDCAAAISGHGRWRTTWYGEQFRADPLSIRPQKVTPASSLHRRTPLWRPDSTDHLNPLWLCSRSSLNRATGCLMRWSLERRMEEGGVVGEVRICPPSPRSRGHGPACAKKGEVRAWRSGGFRGGGMTCGPRSPVKRMHGNRTKADPGGPQVCKTC